MRRHGLTHGFRAAVNQLRIFQQRRSAAAAVDQLRRAAAVEIHPVRAQLNRAGGVFRQPFRILAEQLNTHQRAGRGPALVVQLGAQAEEGFYRQQHIDHAQKLCHAEIVIIHLGQKLAHEGVEHAFHWGQ